MSRWMEQGEGDCQCILLNEIKPYGEKNKPWFLGSRHCRLLSSPIWLNHYHPVVRRVELRYKKYSTKFCTVYVLGNLALQTRRFFESDV